MKLSELDLLTNKALDMLPEDTEHLSDDEWQALFMKKHDQVYTNLTDEQKKEINFN